MTVADFLHLHPDSDFDLLAEFGYISHMGLAQNHRGVVTTDSGNVIPLQTVLDQNVLGVDRQDGGMLLYTGQHVRENMYQEDEPAFVQAM